MGNDVGTRTQAVYKFLTHYPDEIVTSNAIAEECGMTVTQVSNSIANLRRNGVNIQLVFRGAYRYNTSTKVEAAPETPPKGEPEDLWVFRYLGETTKGSLVRHAGNQKLYVVTEVKL